MLNCFSFQIRKMPMSVLMKGLPEKNLIVTRFWQIAHPLYLLSFFILFFWQKLYRKYGYLPTSFFPSYCLLSQTQEESFPTFTFSFITVFKKLDHPWPLSLFSSFQHKIKFAQNWIRTVDLWYRKRLLYQLSHNHCLNSFLHCLVSYIFNCEKCKNKLNNFCHTTIAFMALNQFNQTMKAFLLYPEVINCTLKWYLHKLIRER